MKRTLIFGMTGMLALSASVACVDEAAEAPPPEETKEVPPPPPPKIEIPEYAPTGEFAEVKKEAASGIDDKNAMDRANALEVKLDSALAEIKPAAPTEAASDAAEAAPQEAAAEATEDAAGDKAPAEAAPEAKNESEE